MADETTETPQDEAVTTEPVAAPEPEEQLTPKERRQRRRARARSRQGGGQPRTLEEKIAAREEERRRKAAQRRRRRAKEKAARAEARAAAPATSAEADQAPEHGPGRPKQRQGVVVSARPDKTVIVRLDMVRRHQRYRKILRSTVKVSAHDERNDANEGDTVRVVECRPMSATKRWRLLEIVERAR